jgi:uncharacterized membrane protein
VGIGKYLVGAIGFGFAGAKVGIAAFGGAISGMLPAAAIGMLAVKALSRSPRAENAESFNLVQQRMDLKNASPKKKPQRRVSKAKLSTARTSKLHQR